MEENKEIKQGKKLEKKQIKIKLRTFIIILIAVISIIGGIGLYLVNNTSCTEYDGEYQKVSYQEISYQEEDSLEYKKNIDWPERYKILTSYDEYKELLGKVKRYPEFENVNEKYDYKLFETNNLIAVICKKILIQAGTELIDFYEKGTIANIKIFDYNTTTMANIAGDIYFIPVSKNVNKANVEYEFPTKFKWDFKSNYEAKPVIYIYPEEETAVSVELGAPEKLTCVYPEYNTGWNVVAKPDGTLVNKETGREYYSLYYESENTKIYTEESIKEGFVVSKEEIVPFLEEKLEILGLNYKESEEFIIYWLPRLQANDYIYVRFQTMEEREENMPLSISKEPDTLIRIMMEWKGLDEKIEVKEQKLEEVTRSGFTVVEWGGTEIK